jgi:hypothetical protein
MKANLHKVVARLTGQSEEAATSGVEDFVASAKKFGAKVKESNGLITITISDTKKATQFRSQYVDSKGRILDRETWSEVQGEGPVKGGGAYWEVKAGLQQNKVVARLQEQAADGKKAKLPKGCLGITEWQSASRRLDTRLFNYCLLAKVFIQPVGNEGSDDGSRLAVSTRKLSTNELEYIDFNWDYLYLVGG